MAKKKRAGLAAGLRADSSVQAVQAAPATATASPLPAEAARGDSSWFILALMMFLAPALGAPNEEMLQDTLKSIVVSFAALSATLLFFWQQRERREGLRWHAIVWLPLLLMAYALGSMAWSHAYLGGVEAVRWFIFSLIVWLGLNTLSRERLPLLALGIHAGAVVATLWAALQFWVDFRFFPQGPNPGSTFVNRNFFAEFVVCTLPFAALLLARARQTSLIALLAASTGFIIVGILMTGTRGALIALWLQLGLVLPLIGWRYRHQFALGGWDRGRWLLAGMVLAVTVGGLGMIPTGNSKIVEEERGVTALERGFKRTGSISPQDHSLGIRMIMWKATAVAIQARPLVGLGAGAWESEIPRYQAAGSQLETDYYVHNELLQLVAEYGVAGWIFLALLLGYLTWAAWRTWNARTELEQQEAPYRALMLCCLLAFLIVSNIGFPWRMATTGALFALGLGMLAASDARLAVMGRTFARPLPWKPTYGRPAVAATLGCLVLAAYVSQLAAECESKIIRATKIALTISASNDWHNPRWSVRKAEMLKLIKEGTDINPHYRKVTPMVADELAKWGDWKNATWIWESVLSSRPYVVAIIANVARGYTSMGQPVRAMEYLARAKALQPDAPSVRSLEVILLARTGSEAKALDLAREAFDSRVFDYDLINAGFTLAWRAADYALARRLIEAAANGQRRTLLGQIPKEDWPKLGLLPAPQTSSSSK